MPGDVGARASLTSGPRSPPPGLIPPRMLAIPGLRPRQLLSCTNIFVVPSRPLRDRAPALRSVEAVETPEARPPLVILVVPAREILVCAIYSGCTITLTRNSSTFAPRGPAPAPRTVVGRFAGLEPPLVLGCPVSRVKCCLCSLILLLRLSRPLLAVQSPSPARCPWESQAHTRCPDAPFPPPVPCVHATFSFLDPFVPDFP